MNFNFYILGTPGGAYSQYPNDYSSTMFLEFGKNIAGARLVIHRDHDLVYYYFAQEIDQVNYVGFCVVFNNVRLRNPKRLIEFFKAIICDYASNGTLIEYRKDGALAYNITSFANNTEIYAAIKKNLNRQLESHSEEFGIENLSTVYNGVQSKEVIDSTATNEKIIRLTEKYNSVWVTDELGLKTNLTFSVIDELRKSNEKYQVEIDTLKNDIKVLNRKKKQFRFVVFSIFCVLLCCVGIFILNSNLNNTKQELDIAKYEIRKKDSTISEKNAKISSLNSLNKELEQSRIVAEESLESFKSLISDKASMIITGASIDWSNGLYKFSYYGFADRDIRLIIRTYTSSGYYKENAMDFHIYKGANESEIYIGDYYLDSSKYHSFILFEDNRIIGGSRL